MDRERVEYLLNEVWDPGEAPEMLRAWVTENVVQAAEAFRADLMVALEFHNGEPVVEVSSAVGLSEWSDGPGYRRVPLSVLVAEQDEFAEDDPAGTANRLRRLAGFMEGYAKQMRDKADEIERGNP